MKNALLVYTSALEQNSTAVLAEIPVDLVSSCTAVE